MRNDYPRFQQAGAKIVAVAPHPVDKVRDFWREHKLPFVGVADPEGKLAESYGQEWSLFRLGRMPALLVLDENRRVLLAHYGKSMSDIPSEDRVLQVLGRAFGL
ncbi:MAG: redoxin domain-containing protein [Deltaproteobacteria bacterium]|nr:redoxin domain-containing protein [Deltaproteobacteria bacterium]